MTILLIAILPALAVLVIAGLTGDRFWTWVAAAAAGFFGVVSGQPAFAFLDLGAVALAMWIALLGLKKHPLSVKPQPQPQPQLAPIQEKPSEGLGVSGVLGLFVVAALGFKFFGPATVVPVSTQAQPAAPVTALAPVPKVPPVKALKPVDRMSQKPRQSVKPTSTQDPGTAAIKPTPLEQCLSIPSEAGMGRCLERLK